MDVIPIKGHEAWGVRFVVCGNDERLGIDVEGTPYRRSDAVGAAVTAAGRKIEAAGYDYECDSCFQHWNGGKHTQFPTVRGGEVVAYIYHRDRLGEEDDEWGDWEFCAKTVEIPADVIAAVEKVCDDAADAMFDEIESIHATATKADEATNKESPCFCCTRPATRWTCYGRNPDWVEGRCADHSFPLNHWADPHASCGPDRGSPAAAAADGR